MEKIFYTVREVSEMLKIKPVSLRRLLKKGALTYYKIGGIKISQEDLEVYLKKVRVSGNDLKNRYFLQ